MKKKMRKLLRFLLLVVLIVSLVMLGRRFLDNRSGGEAYSAAEQLASAPREEKESLPAETAAENGWVPESVEGDPHAEALKQINLDALREVNPDVVGWIQIPGTNVNYPLMQGEDNDFYLKNTWEGEENSMGSIFMEYQCSPDLTDFNTIVYGHNMTDRTMFAALKSYSGQEYWEEHPYVYIVSDAGVYRYEIYSSYKADVGSDTYALFIKKTETKQTYIDLTLEQSVIDTGIVPETTDRILTLSTCSHMGYDTRWVVHARLKMVEAEA